MFSVIVYKPEVKTIVFTNLKTASCNDCLLLIFNIGKERVEYSTETYFLFKNFQIIKSSAAQSFSNFRVIRVMPNTPCQVGSGCSGNFFFL